MFFGLQGKNPPGPTKLPLPAGIIRIGKVERTKEGLTIISDWHFDPSKRYNQPAALRLNRGEGVLVSGFSIQDLEKISKNRHLYQDS